MMDSEDLQSELLALRRLYRLLVNGRQCVKDAVSENLDKNARQLLISLLDDASKKAFGALEKMLGTQFRPSYSLWSTPKFPNLQITSQGILNEPRSQPVSSGESRSILADESDVKLKRCRVCQKPKVQQLTKETNFQDTQHPNHKRRWEVVNDPTGVQGLASSSNSPLTVDFMKSLSLYDQTQEDDQISREASAKIQQIDSCISALKVAPKHVNLLEYNPESQPSQTGNFTNDPNSRMTWKPRDIEFPTGMMFPSSQTISQTAENQHDYHHMPEESYNLFHGSGVGVSSDFNKMVNKDLYTYPNQINRQHLDQLQMAKKEAMPMREMTQWLVPHNNELQELETTRRKNPEMGHYRNRGKHKRVSPESQWLSHSDSPVSRSNNSSSWSTQSESQQSYTSCRESEGSSPKVYSESSRSKGGEESVSESESEKYSVSSQSQSQSQSETEIESQSQSPEMSSSYESSRSTSRRTAPTKKGNQKEPKTEKVGRFKKLKDKLAVVFHQHHHHYHHHHHHGDEDNHKKSLQKHAEKVVEHSRKKEEAVDYSRKKEKVVDHSRKEEEVVDHGRRKEETVDHHRRRKEEEGHGEKVVKKNEKKALVHKVVEKNQKGHFQALVGGFLKHTHDSKKSKKSKSDKQIVPKGKSGKKSGGKMGKKMSWLKMLHQQRRIKRVEKLRGKLHHG